AMTATKTRSSFSRNANRQPVGICVVTPYLGATNGSVKGRSLTGSMQLFTIARRIKKPFIRAIFLRIAYVLGLGGLDNSSSSGGATVHRLGALAPGPGDTSKEAFSSPGGATGASRGRALLSPRLGLGTGKRKGRLGTSWGLRRNCIYAASPLLIMIRTALISILAVTHNHTRS